MKKYLFLITFIFIFFNCNKTKSQSDIENDKKLINNFIKNIILKENNCNYEEINKLTMLYAQNQSNKTKIQLDSLAKNILLKNNKKYKTYLNFYDKTENDKNKIIEMVNYAIMLNKESIKREEWYSHKIVHYEEVKNYSKIKSSKIYKELKYNKLNTVYFSIFDNNENSVCLYVVENNKIISFFPHLNIGNDPIEPYLLNKKYNNKI